jgi:hypothetical protein
MSGKNVGFRDDLKKDGYSKEEEYFNRMNRERFEQRQKKSEFIRVLPTETQIGSLRRFWNILRRKHKH